MTSHHINGVILPIAGRSEYIDDIVDISNTAYRSNDWPGEYYITWAHFGAKIVMCHTFYRCNTIKES